MEAGFALLQQRLRSLTEKEGQKIQRAGLKRAGEIFEEAIVERAPVKTESARGVLPRGGLKASVKKRVSVPDDLRVVQGKKARVVIGPTGKLEKLIAHDVEYGHNNPTAKNPKKRKRTPAHPFIRPAAEFSKVRAEAEYRRVVIAGVKKAMKSNG